MADLNYSYYGGPNLANDGNFRTSFRSHFASYYYPDPAPTLYISTSSENTFDEIKIYNRFEKASRINSADASIVVYFIGSTKKILWSSILRGSAYLYHFTNVFSGARSNIAMGERSLVAEKSEDSVSFSAAATKINIFQFKAIVLQQNNIDYYLQCAEIEIFYQVKHCIKSKNFCFYLMIAMIYIRLHCTDYN